MPCVNVYLFDFWHLFVSYGCFSLTINSFVHCFDIICDADSSNVDNVCWSLGTNCLSK